jgi:hypothetical protein
MLFWQTGYRVDDREISGWSGRVNNFPEMVGFHIRGWYPVSPMGKHVMMIASKRINGPVSAFCHSHCQIKYGLAISSSGMSTPIVVVCVIMFRQHSFRELQFY